MGLQPKAQVYGLSDKADSFLLKDITGLYDGTVNPGGYGAPNITKGNVVAILIELYNEGNPTVRLFYRPSSLNPFLDGIDPQTITPALFGSTGYFTPGVMFIRYSVLTANVVLTSVSSDNKVVNSATGFRSNESVVVAGNISYRVDITANNTPSSLHLLDPIPANTTIVAPGYLIEVPLLNTKKLESDLAKAIGKYATECGCSNNRTLELVDILLSKIGAEVRFGCMDYVGAQAIITAALNDLGGGCGSC